MTAKGREDGWIADFTHSLHRDGGQLRPLFCGR